jgi:hypothetical protein
MTAPIQIVHEPLAGWSRRLALFAAALVVFALAAHRLGQLAPPVAINAWLVGFGLSALAILAGLYAGISIWIRGRAGAGKTAAGVLVAAVMWLWPLAYAPTYLTLPKINDVSTDLVNVPRFGILSQVRGEGANTAQWKPAFASEQQRAYPDLRTLVIDRPVDEVFDLVARLIGGRRGLGWKVVTREEPALRPQPKPGWIQATERTIVLGFVDDIVIRVAGTDNETRVDIRSASRFGAHDLGTNANRIRRFMRELIGRLEATTPGAIAARGGSLRAARAGAVESGVLKRPRERSGEKAVGKSGSGPVLPDARRAPEKKAPPRG